MKESPLMIKSKDFVLEHYLKTGRFDKNLYGGVATSSGLSFICMDE